MPFHSSFSAASCKSFWGVLFFMITLERPLVLTRYGGIETRRSSLSFEPIQAPLQIRSRTEAMKKVNSQLSLSFHTRVSKTKNAVSYLSPLTGYWSFKASTASTNPFPALGGPLLQGNLFHFLILVISLIHHPSRGNKEPKACMGLEPPSDSVEARKSDLKKYPTCLRCGGLK